jgi:hypothetical protein
MCYCLLGVLELIGMNIWKGRKNRILKRKVVTRWVRVLMVGVGVDMIGTNWLNEISSCVFPYVSDSANISFAKLTLSTFRSGDCLRTVLSNKLHNEQHIIICRTRMSFLQAILWEVIYKEIQL